MRDRRISNGSVERAVRGEAVGTADGERWYGGRRAIVFK
jgi:hypothetical protein